MAFLGSKNHNQKQQQQERQSYAPSTHHTGRRHQTHTTTTTTTTTAKHTERQRDPDRHKGNDGLSSRPQSGTNRTCHSKNLDLSQTGVEILTWPWCPVKERHSLLGKREMEGASAAAVDASSVEGIPCPSVDMTLFLSRSLCPFCSSPSFSCGCCFFGVLGFACVYRKRGWHMHVGMHVGGVVMFTYVCVYGDRGVCVCTCVGLQKPDLGP